MQSSHIWIRYSLQEWTFIYIWIRIEYEHVLILQIKKIRLGIFEQIERQLSVFVSHIDCRH